MKKKILIIIAPAINTTFQDIFKRELFDDRFLFKIFKPPFCALTLPVHTSLYTGKLPQNTGIVANGLYLEKLNSINFWNQSYGLVDIEPFWKNKNIRTALIFTQLSLGSSADIVITPKPVHLHHGGMIEYCYTKPYELYNELIKTLGPFKLKWYWGPFVSIKSSLWIKNATIYILKNYKPDVAFSYIPHMDYISQKVGYNDNFTTYKELSKVINIIKELSQISEVLGYDLIVLSDYGADFVTSARYPNKILKENGFIKTYNVGKYEYIDLYESDAFALCDHQIAYVFCKKENIEGEIYKLFKNNYTNCYILNRNELIECGIYHKNMGSIAMFAKQEWFSYKWWGENDQGPDYKTHVDIHKKEGYDPLELFFDIYKLGIAQNENLIKMSMGNGFLQSSKGIFISRLTYNSNFFELRNEVQPQDIVEYIIGLV